MPENHPTLAEVLRERGYCTVAFTEGEARSRRDIRLRDDFGRGFEIFDPSYAEEDPTSSDSGNAYGSG